MLRRHVLWTTALCGMLWGTTVFAQTVRAKPEETKSSDSLRAVFRSVVERANRATVSIVARGGAGEATKGLQVAFGTIVSADGYVLTKASEVIGRKNLQVVGGASPSDVHDAAIVGLSEPQDLAMLKISAKGLTAVEWADLKANPVDVGEWVATAGPVAMEEKDPVAVGVVSVGRRKIPGRLGFLGVAMGDTTDNSGAKINQVIPGSAAAKAGVKLDDVISAVDGKPVKTRVDLSLLVRAYRPGDVVTLTVRRGTETQELEATLGTNEIESPSRFSMMNLLGGPVSKRASDFSVVLQHDTVLRPMDCGGPLVDLSGKVIGINIARAGRTETYALPADIVVPLLAGLESGKMAPVNANRPGAGGTGGTGAGEKPTTLPERGE